VNKALKLIVAKSTVGGPIAVEAMVAEGVQRQELYNRAAAAALKDADAGFTQEEKAEIAEYIKPPSSGDALSHGTKRNKRLQVRVNEAEEELIRKNAAQSGFDVSSYVRLKALS